MTDLQDTLVEAIGVISARDPVLAQRIGAAAAQRHSPAPTDDLPQANVAIPTGSEIRLAQRGGVVLTQAPFNLRVVQSRWLCGQPEFGGMIVTMAYRLAS